MEPGWLFWHQRWSHSANNWATGLSYCPPGAGIVPSCFSTWLLRTCNSLPLNFHSCHFQPLLPTLPHDLCCPMASAYCLSSVVPWRYSHNRYPHRYLVSWSYLDSHLPKEETLIGLLNYSVPVWQSHTKFLRCLWAQSAVAREQQGCGHSRHSVSNGFCSDTKVVSTQFFPSSSFFLFLFFSTSLHASLYPGHAVMQQNIASNAFYFTHRY